MPERLKFHLDENISNAVAKGLIRRGIDVTTTAKENLIGASDQEQLAFALSQGRVLVTQDDDFLRLHQFGKLHAGIVYCRKSSRSTGEIIQALGLLWECVAPEEISVQVEFI
jgi:predicted nuclease of predicted toxin-antitoxin system